MQQELLAYESPPIRGSPGPSPLVSAVVLVMWSALAGLPGGILLEGYACFFGAACHLGRLPSYGRPDPGTLPARVMFPSSMGPLCFAVVTLAVAVLCRRLFRNSLKAQFMVVGVLAAVLWMLVVVDPLGALNWYMD